MARIRRFSESLPMLLLRARESAMSRFRPVLHEQGLTEQQWRVLRALDDLGALSAAGLAGECCILAPSITRILRKLTEARLVTMTRSTIDQRELEVRITARGKRLVEAIAPKIEREYEAIVEQLDPDYLDALARELQRLIALNGPGQDP